MNVQPLSSFQSPRVARISSSDLTLTRSPGCTRDARLARFRRSDLLVEVQDCGARSLAIISLVNFLVGLILAFVGAVQLRMFGAQIYVAHLVGIATVREIAAIMTGVVVTGRTGAGAYGLPLASFAKQLGRQAIHLGGVTQILFGIKGRRWEREYADSTARLFNEHWVRPLPAETPAHKDRIEKGCYW